MSVDAPECLRQDRRGRRGPRGARARFACGRRIFQFLPQPDPSRWPPRSGGSRKFREDGSLDGFVFGKSPSSDARADDVTGSRCPSSSGSHCVAPTTSSPLPPHELPRSPSSAARPDHAAEDSRSCRASARPLRRNRRRALRRGAARASAGRNRTPKTPNRRSNARVEDDRARRRGLAPRWGWRWRSDRRPLPPPPRGSDHEERRYNLLALFNAALVVPRRNRRLAPASRRRCGVTHHGGRRPPGRRAAAARRRLDADGRGCRRRRRVAALTAAERKSGGAVAGAERRRPATAKGARPCASGAPAPTQHGRPPPPTSDRLAKSPPPACSGGGRLSARARAARLVTPAAEAAARRRGRDNHRRRARTASNSSASSRCSAEPRGGVLRQNAEAVEANASLTTAPRLLDPMAMGAEGRRCASAPRRRGRVSSSPAASSSARRRWPAPDRRSNSSVDATRSPPRGDHDVCRCFLRGTLRLRLLDRGADRREGGRHLRRSPNACATIGRDACDVLIASAPGYADPPHRTTDMIAQQISRSTLSPRSTCSTRVAALSWSGVGEGDDARRAAVAALAPRARFNDDRRAATPTRASAGRGAGSAAEVDVGGRRRCRRGRAAVDVDRAMPPRAPPRADRA